MKVFELTNDQLAWVYRNQGKGITIKDAVEKMLPQLVGLQWKRKDKIVTIIEGEQMRERIECPYCGNQFSFNEHIEGLLLITSYTWDYDNQRYKPQGVMHGDHDDANLFCSVCTRMLLPEEYDKFLEVTA